MKAEEIQQRMAELRRNLSDDVAEIRDSSGTMLDWRYYFKRYPLPIVATAAAIGFLIVPKRVEVVRPDPEDLARLAREDKVVFKQAPATKTHKGLGSMAMGLAASALLRAGTAYLGQQAGKFFGELSAHSNGQSHASKQQPSTTTHDHASRQQ